ncbi:transporter, major facilitator family protein [Bifidobacterium actinocoloniiforme DSM 22766]|uniref:Transporter, major facilitator family protein n=1 Tax=Bifidobacterium actinocoloniiforme DSM 22766 TaxID=1437605 RepID=A0A086Z2A8_9BIFI|nr:MFS transporter [Bifidobacterium actinocoloniiforme]AKV55673.1 sugar transporter [Bifidobacterium actinocoloniiforme DSM 22766]KFI40658.1 transporter, major facilitator family protein [Bifidobacterium actinocoloniiforme DSM 22766]
MSDSNASVARPQQTAYELIDSRPLTGHQKSIIGLAIAGNISEFFDMFLIGFVVSLLTSAWHLTGTSVGIILACSGLGTVIGSIVWGRLSDKFGRKHAFQWCVICFVIFTALSVFLPDGAWVLLAILRVGVGIGVGGLNIISIPYVQEFVPAKQRGVLSGLASVFIPMGLLLGSVAQSLIGGNWRLLVALGVIPVLLLFWLATVPESPRFYQSIGKDDKAREALAWALEMPASEVGALPEVKEEKKASYSLLFSKSLKPLVIISLGSFCFILGSFAIQSWGQTLMKDAFGFSTQMVAYLFMGVSVADCIGRFGSAWLADVIGRRWTMFSFGIIGAAGCFYAAFFHSSGWQFYIAVLIIMTFADGVFGILNAFGGEQFPNDVRSTGLGLGYGIGAIAKIVGPIVMGALVGGSYVAQHIDISVITKAFTFFGVCLVIGAVTYLFAQETKGKDLESL